MLYYISEDSTTCTHIYTYTHTYTHTSLSLYIYIHAHRLSCFHNMHLHGILPNKETLFVVWPSYLIQITCISVNIRDALPFRWDLFARYIKLYYNATSYLNACWLFLRELLYLPVANLVIVVERTYFYIHRCALLSNHCLDLLPI